MAFRNQSSCNKASALRRQIAKASRTIKSSTEPSPILIVLGFLASNAVLPAAAEETHYEWRCKPAGEGWSCQEVSAEGPAYDRPTHTTRKGSQQSKKARSGTDAITAKARNLKAAEVDWVHADQLTAEQKADMKDGCCGRYIEPQRTDDDAQLKPEAAALRADADSSEVVQETLAVLEGDVLLTQGYRTLQADRAELDQAADTAKLSGQVRLREPGVLITGDEMFIDIASGNGTVENASYLMHEAGVRGDAVQLENNRQENTLTLSDSTYTQCTPESTSWTLRANELKIDGDSRQGSGKHVRVHVKGVPVFYTPYIRFPVGDERMSGLLFPTIASGDSGGIDFALPYYWNIAPNLDATITPRLKDGHGEMLELETRHLSKSFETQVSLGYLDNDDGGEDEDLDDLIASGIITEAEAYPNQGEDRWLASIQQTGGLNARWYSSLDITAVSDNDYFRDLDTASLDVNSQTHLTKTGRIGYNGQHWDSSLRVTEYQTISENTTSPYKQLPRINIDGDYRLGTWQIDLDHEYVNFDHREDFINGNENDPRIVGERLRTDYSLTWDKDWVWGFLKPSAKLKTLNYKLDADTLLANAEDSPSFAVPQGALDAGLFFERQGNRYLQTFEPRLFYLYSDYENQDELINVSANGRDVDFDTSALTFTYNQLFRDSRFSGGDRIGDDDRLSIGLTTRFIDDNTGTERFRASLGQILYFDDRAISIGNTSADTLTNSENRDTDSEIASQFAARIGNHWTFSADIMFDPDNSDKVSRGNTSLRYRDDSYNLFNLSYRYNRDEDIILFDGELKEQTIEQADVSFFMPLYGNWNLIGRYNYDFNFDRKLDTFAGLEYNSCCYRMRVIARQWLDNDLVNVVSDSELDEDRGIFFEFQLKGLGGTGNSVTGILQDGIYGYDLREENLK